MNEDRLTSVSRGCFVVRGKGKGRKKLDAKDYISGFKLPAKERWAMAAEVWKDMDEKVQSLKSKLTYDIFRDLINFITKSSENRKELNGRRSEIPSAALITGVNMPDHASLFSRLCDEIKESATPHVAVLCAKNCPNMKALLRCIGQQLILGENEDLHNASVEENEADQNQPEQSSSLIWKRSIPLTMPLLEKWYLVASHSFGSKTPKKRKKETPEKTPIVVVIRDTEAFLPNLLQDLIAMFSAMLSSLPVILIFGVATSWASVVDRQLPHSATVHLSLEKFYCPSASQHLTLVVNEILLNSQHPFKLGGKCMELLLDVFLCHDFSVTNFLMMLKFCVLEHFYEEPASIFCNDDITRIEKDINKASKQLLSHLQNLPSMKKFLSALTGKQKELISKSDEETKALIFSMIKDLHNFHKHFFPAMQALFSLCKSLPKHPLGRHLRELYCACHHGPICDSEEYKQANLFLSVSSKDQLSERLNSCLLELEKLTPANKKKNEHLPNTLASRTSDAIFGLKSVISDLSRLDELEEADDGEENTQEDDAEVDKPLEKVKYAYQLKEKLQNRSKEKKMKKMTRYEKLRLKSIEILDVLFRKVLLQPRSLPLHEIYYFDSTSTVKRHMVAAPRLAIQTALSDPRYYLQQQCLDSTDGVIPPSAPDMCVAYKLHNECGRIINLYDWLEAFHTIVSSQNDVDEETPVEEINEVTQARFIRAASELQFLGFIKPTKKKTDHVQRLTWSHS